MVTRELVRALVKDYSPTGFADVIKAACAPATFVPVTGQTLKEKDLPAVNILGVVKDLTGEANLAAPLLVADIPLGEKPLTERSSRIQQFKVARKALEQVCVNPPVAVSGIIVQGVFAFHDQQGNFRVSLVTAKAENGKLVWSQVKRQSFYVTPDPDRNATFIQRMTANWSSLAAIKEAFSVEKLTKEFYSQLFKWYERACEDKRVEYPNDVATDNDNRDDKTRKHLLRLITRLMFVWFLKQKGLVPPKLFDEVELKSLLKNFNPVSKDQHQYYRAILQNLFFATLNSEIDERGFAETPTPNRKGEKPTTKHHGVKTKYRYAGEFAVAREKVIELFHKVPFLNGGLFECLDQEGEDGKVLYYDGFSLQEFHRDRHTLTWAHVPNDLFFDPEYGIIPLLKRYNFTVEENTPGDEDVALDPELLGKVFENLLGAYNPETEEVVRNSTGSFYTPREIVNYMVDESLIAYLEGKMGGAPGGRPLPTDGRAVAPRPPQMCDGRDGVPSPSVIRLLVKEGVRPADLALCRRLIEAIENAKILDPACGSGAFPMGALLKMAELLRILKKLPEDANLYDLKLQLIENCIFGVDIQEIAVQISKLRFFISLVCEQKPDWSKPNYGINTLPNLETKFVAANSLIGLKRTDAKDGDASYSQADLFFDSGEIEQIKKELWDVRHKHFLAKTRKEKNALRKEDKELRTKLAKRGKELGYADDTTRLMASWDPYNQNVHAEFFDPAWMFNVKDGFDVVIGNPPYVQLRANGGELAKIYQDKSFATFDGAGDIYCLFYERGFRFLAEKGVLCYITSNKWMRTNYGRNLRQFLSSETNPCLLLDFAGEKIFESASVDTNILLTTREKNSMKTIAATATAECHDGIEDFVAGNHVICAYNSGDPWLILTEAEEKLRIAIAVGKPLAELNLQINYGLKTGFNDAFIVTTETRDSLLKKCSSKEERDRTEDVFKPIVRGRDVVRYSKNWAQLYLLFIPWHFPLQDDSTIEGASRKSEGEFKKRYPTLHEYLEGYRTELSKRNKAETGIRYEWYALQRWGSAYWQDFCQPKLIWAETMRIWKGSDARFPRFSYDDGGFYTDKTCFFATGSDLKYVLANLNSAVGRYQCSKEVAILDNGGYLMQKIYLERIRVAPATPAQKKQVVALVDQVLLAKKENPEADTEKIEAEIDDLIYDLYGLTAEEREIVEKSCEKPAKEAKKPTPAVKKAKAAPKPAAAVKKAKEAKKPEIEEEF